MSYHHNQQRQQRQHHQIIQGMWMKSYHVRMLDDVHKHMNSWTHWPGKESSQIWKTVSLFVFLLMTKGLDGLPDLLPFIPPQKNGWDHKHQQTLVVQGLEMFLFFFLVVWIPKNPRVEALLATHYGIIYLLAVFGYISCQTATRKRVCESCLTCFPV